MYLNYTYQNLHRVLLMAHINYVTINIYSRRSVKATGSLHSQTILHLWSRVLFREKAAIVPSPAPLLVIVYFGGRINRTNYAEQQTASYIFPHSSFYL